MKTRTWLTNVIAFCSKTTSVGEDEALDDIYIGFIKAFDRVFSNTLMKIRMKHWLCWVGSEVEWKLTEVWDPEHSHPEHNVQLKASYYWFLVWVMLGPTVFNIFFTDLDYRMSHFQWQQETHTPSVFPPDAGCVANVWYWAISHPSLLSSSLHACEIKLQNAGN